MAKQLVIEDTAILEFPQEDTVLWVQAHPDCFLSESEIQEKMKAIDTKCEELDKALLSTTSEDEAADIVFTLEALRNDYASLLQVQELREHETLANFILHGEINIGKGAVLLTCLDALLEGRAKLHTRNIYTACPEVKQVIFHSP